MLTTREIRDAAHDANLSADPDDGWGVCLNCHHETHDSQAEAYECPMCGEEEVYPSPAATLAAARPPAWASLTIHVTPSPRKRPRGPARRPQLDSERQNGDNCGLIPSTGRLLPRRSRCSSVARPTRR